MKQQRLDVIIEVLKETKPVLKDFFLKATNSDLATDAENLCIGLGLSVRLDYISDNKYIMRASFGNRIIEVSRNTFSMGNFGTSNEIKINYEIGNKKYYAYYSESSGGYVRMNPLPVSIGVA